MNQEKIGKFIAEIRKEKNLTQEQLGERLNVTSKSISRWENGKTMPDVSLFEPLPHPATVEISITASNANAINFFFILILLLLPRHTNLLQVVHTFHQK